jgi:hypothetical protein
VGTRQKTGRKSRGVGSDSKGYLKVATLNAMRIGLQNQAASYRERTKGGDGGDGAV